jgi:hypothetical protein
MAQPETKSRPTPRREAHAPSSIARAIGVRPEAGKRPGASSGTPPKRNVLPLVWSVLFLVGGGLILYTLPDRSNDAIPDVWSPTATSDVTALQTEVRAGGEQQGDLLRLTWPAHPEAESYRVQFATNGIGLMPISVNGNVFLYDLASNVLGLPSRFTWQVTALMADGSEVVSPARAFSLE